MAAYADSGRGASGGRGGSGGSGRRGGSGGRGGAGGARRAEAPPVVGDVQHDPVVETSQRQRGLRRLRVFLHIGQGALGDAQQCGLQSVGQRRVRRFPLHVTADGEPPLRLGRLTGGQRVQGRFQSAALREIGRCQVVDETTGLGEVAFRDARRRTDMAAGGLRVGVPDPVGGLEQHLLTGQPLGEGVVDLHREPLAFGEGALTALGGGQFAAGAQQVVDQFPLTLGQLALPYGLTPHVHEHRRGDRRHRGRGQHQVRVETTGQAQLRGDDEKGEQGDERECGAWREDPQPGVEQRDRAPREARCEDDHHHPDRDQRSQPHHAAWRRARTEHRPEHVQRRERDGQRDDPRSTGLAGVPQQEAGQRGTEEHEERGVHQEHEPPGPRIAEAVRVEGVASARGPPARGPPAGGSRGPPAGEAGCRSGPVLRHLVPLAPRRRPSPSSSTFTAVAEDRRDLRGHTPWSPGTTTPASADRPMGPSTDPSAGSSRFVDRTGPGETGGSMAERETPAHHRSRTRRRSPSWRRTRRRTRTRSRPCAPVS